MLVIVFLPKKLEISDYTQQKGVKAFELELREDGKLLHVKVYLEAILLRFEKFLAGKQRFSSDTDCG